jgi:hypothetical protein
MGVIQSGECSEFGCSRHREPEADRRSAAQKGT